MAAPGRSTAGAAVGAVFDGQERGRAARNADDTIQTIEAYWKNTHRMRHARAMPLRSYDIRELRDVCRSNLDDIIGKF